MSEFHKFAELVRDKFKAISQHELFTVALPDKDHVWDSYLEGYPIGTNPIFRERTEHDCSCCKQFIRNVGNVVAIIDDDIVSVWDIENAEYPFDVVAKQLSEEVKSLPIENVFRTKEGGYGAEHTIELIDGNNTRKWHHFSAKIHGRHHNSYPDAEKGNFASIARVFRRGLDELSEDAISTVLELIQSNAIYRGAEFKKSVVAFGRLKSAYDLSTNKDLFIWQHIEDPAARFRNTAIGTLVQELSEGVDIERAVGAFETKVAPMNYKRPTSLITSRMVDDAMATIKEMDLEKSLERRFAKMTDISVNNVLFVDNSVQGTMKGGIHGLLMDEATKKQPNINNPQDISIDDFMQNVLPNTKSIDLMLTNGLTQNFVSLTAPVHEDARGLFKWDNGFAWSYDGNAADTIKEKVKRAGGNVEATLRVSLAWHNYDDLDIHVVEPNGNEIYYGNRGNKLDVDMNATGGNTRDPVENVSWVGRVPDGEYLVTVDQYRRRETIDVGFVLEVEHEENVQTFTYDMAVSDSLYCLKLTVKNGSLVSVDCANSKLVSGSAGVEKWGVTTEQFIPVDTIMTSPNHWDGNATGNKHWFFFLKDCRNPEPARGIYNEFLKSSLEKHRKVFEVLGAKTRCPVTNDQVSGVGFSSTRHDQVIVLARNDRMQKAYNIIF